MSNIGILGERDQGQDVRTNNVTAVLAVANIVKSSLGPQGLDKMLVDDLGDVTITNDGATILKLLEIEHPAAKVIVELSHLQDQEVGDGTTSVVILAAELLKRANDLIKNKVHPTNIIAGYKLAAKEACKFLEENMALSVKELGVDALINVAKTSMSSKLIGPERDLFSKLCVSAVQQTKVITVMGDEKYPIKNINILKSHGQSSMQSELITGYVLQTMRASQQMRTKVDKCKVACLDFNLNKFKLQMGIQVLVTDPKNLEKIRFKECEILKERCQKVIAAGANVILTTKAIDDIAQKYLVDANVLGIRRVDKHDLRRIAGATGATIVTTLATPEGEEEFNPACLGECETVYEEAIGDNDFIFFRGMKKANCASIIIRGANELMCDEIERSIHDSLCVVKRTLESGYVVPGGGSCEVALSIKLEDYSKTLGNKEQEAISEFCEALTIIPKVLAQNAAKDASELVSKLRQLHYASQNPQDDKQKQYKWMGLDLVQGKIRDNVKSGVVEPLVSKVKCIRFATEAAITILRIDDMIKLEKKSEEMPGRGMGGGGMPGMGGMPQMMG